jgi:hypothetical protein
MRDMTTWFSDAYASWQELGGVLAWGPPEELELVDDVQTIENEGGILATSALTRSRNEGTLSPSSRAKTILPK